MVGWPDNICFGARVQFADYRFALCCLSLTQALNETNGVERDAEPRT
jgi:hypothetical protein